MNLEFLYLGEGREPRGKTRFPPHLWDKWEGKQLIMRGNFDLLMRGLVILVLAVAIYDAGGFYVISIYCRRSGLWYSALTNVAIVMKKRGGVIRCRN